MQKKRPSSTVKIAAAQEERGVLLVNTGNGKGKSSAAFWRRRPRPRPRPAGRRRAVRQGPLGYRRRGAFSAASPGGTGMSAAKALPGKPRTRDRDAKAAQAAWGSRLWPPERPAIGLVVLDEMTYAFKYGWLDLDTVIARLLSRPPMQHVIITGLPRRRRCAMADTVSDIGMEKHASRAASRRCRGWSFKHSHTIHFSLEFTFFGCPNLPCREE